MSTVCFDSFPIKESWLYGFVQRDTPFAPIIRISRVIHKKYIFNFSRSRNESSQIHVRPVCRKAFFSFAADSCNLEENTVHLPARFHVRIVILIRAARTFSLRPVHIRFLVCASKCTRVPPTGSSLTTRKAPLNTLFCVSSHSLTNH